MKGKIRVRSKGLLGEGHLETVLEVENVSQRKVGDPIVTMFPQTGRAHVECNIIEIIDDVPAMT